MKTKMITTGVFAFAMLTGMATPACYANGTSIAKNTAPANTAWNEAWGSAWSLSKEMAKTDEAGALANCRDTLMARNELFATAGNYEVWVSDSIRSWSLRITSTGQGKGAAVCMVH